MKIGTCRVCGGETYPQRRVDGRCQACTSYWRRHGTERPKEPPRCTICGERARGVTRLCRRHYQQTRLARQRAGEIPMHCTNCQRDLELPVAYTLVENEETTYAFCGYFCLVLWVYRQGQVALEAASVA